MVKEQILLTDKVPIKVNNMTDDQVIKLLTDRRSNLRKKDSGFKLNLLKSLKASKGSQSNSSLRKNSDNSQQLLNSKSLADIQTIAKVKHPELQRIKKYNEGVN